MPGFDRRWGGGGSFCEVPRSKSAPLNRTSLGHQDAPSPLPNRCASDAAEPECRGRPRPVFALPFLPEGTLSFYSRRSLSRPTFPPPSALSSPFSSVSDPSGSHLQGPWLQSLRTPRATSPACPRPWLLSFALLPCSPTDTRLPCMGPIFLAPHSNPRHDNAWTLCTPLPGGH